MSITRLIGVVLILLPEAALTTTLGATLIGLSFLDTHSKYPELMGRCRCYSCSGYKTFLERR